MRSMADTFDGGMIALVPTEDSAELLAVDGGEDVAELHLTLTYLGSIDEIPDDQRTKIVDAVERIAEQTPPVTARAFSHATFNPDRHDDRDPCAVYLIGDTTALEPLKAEFDQFAAVDQHASYIPHVTGGYDLTAPDLTFVGPVTFDAVRVAIGEANIIIPLTGGDEESSEEGDEDDGAGG
jgi:hypothetical protein